MLALGASFFPNQANWTGAIPRPPYIPTILPHLCMGVETSVALPPDWQYFSTLFRGYGVAL